MTKEITKAIILEEIQDKFRLRDLVPEKFTFDEMVVPTYDISPHLLKWEVHSAKASVTGTGQRYYFTVPDDERWTIRSYMVLFYSEGAYQVSGVFISFRPAVADYIYLDLKKNQASTYLVNLPIPVVLSPGNRLYVFVDTFVSTADLELILDIQKETIR